MTLWIRTGTNILYIASMAHIEDTNCNSDTAFL